MSFGKTLPNPSERQGREYRTVATTLRVYTETQDRVVLDYALTHVSDLREVVYSNHRAAVSEWRTSEGSYRNGKRAAVTVRRCWSDCSVRSLTTRAKRARNRARVDAGQPAPVGWACPWHANRSPCSMSRGVFLTFALVFVLAYNRYAQN